jgi:hypothetical protein
VTLLEKRSNNLDERQRREIVHVYLKGVGLVERRETLPLAGKEKRTLGELKLIKVEDSKGPLPEKKGP